jgi:hypothetical protein
MIILLASTEGEVAVVIQEATSGSHVASHNGERYFGQLTRQHLRDRTLLVSHDSRTSSYWWSTVH